MTGETCRRLGPADQDHLATASAEHKDQADRLFGVLAGLPPGHLRDRTRHQLVEMHLPLVRYFVRRYLGRGQPYDDLLQAGALGLVKAVDRFDRDRGLEFSTYAGPLIVGEIKRHFRDRAWSVHVEPALRDLTLQVSRHVLELSQQLGRFPTTAELARRCGHPEAAVQDALRCATASRALSLDEPSGEDRRLGDTVGLEDQNLADVELRESLGPALSMLTERERRILQLRYYGNMSQREIAGRVGISQMHVSRILSRTLTRLRAYLLEDRQADAVPRPRPETPDPALGRRPR